MDPLTLLLVGVVVSAINGGVLMVLNSLAPAGIKADLMSYVMGSISTEITWGVLLMAVVVVAVGFVPILLSGRALNVGSLSDVEATSLGVNVGQLRTICFISASVMTGAAIMLSGPIGFVGLICPHICRGLVGADHRKLVVAAPLCGAAFLMAADTFVRATGGLFYGELPVGVVTALCGGPFFLMLLKRRGTM
jgi:iron complex transport system permease protein